MKAKVIASAPVLLVKDVTHSANWYRDKLGFRYDEIFGDPPRFCIPERDGFYLMLCQCEEDKILPHWKIIDKMWNAYFWVNDVEEIYKEFKSNDTTIDYELCIKPYGVKEFGINDPDGYDIAFGQVMR
jgi:Glyoxalase/Bleomycin resistance protein/Dioxygenase superfamily